MKKGIYVDNTVKLFLPQGASVISLQNQKGGAAIQYGDMDGDGYSEIAVAYNLRDEIHVMVLKKCNNRWYRVAQVKEDGYNINFIGLRDITGDGRAELLVGWQVGAIWSRLYVYTLEGNSLNKIVDGIQYSMVEVMDTWENKHITDRSRIALWIHDTGEAYRVDILYWNGYDLISDKKAYPYYFRKVVAYYNKKVKEMPDAAFYWYYLADAQVKAGMAEEALASIANGQKLNADYPPKDEFMKLKEMAEKMLKPRETILYPASINTIEGVKWGYINNKGEVVIEPQYTMAAEFQVNGLAVVNVGDLSGLIDTGGRFVVKPRYGSIGDYHEGRAIAADNDGFVVLDERGNEIFKSKNYIGNFYSNRATFAEVGDKWLYGYIDTQGKKEILPVYATAGDFVNGKAVVGFTDGGYAIIDTKGNVINKFNHAYVGDISEGFLPFKYSNDGKFGFMDEQGNTIIQPTYSWVEGFSGQRAIVNTSPDYGNMYGLIDNLGKIVVTPQYNDMRDLGEGLFAVGIAIDKDNTFKGSKYAIADMNGKFLTDFIYFGVSNYKNGLASAYDSTNTFFIDKFGKRVNSLPVMQGIGMMEFKGELIRADIDRRTSYLDRDGKVIWKQNTQIPVGGKYIVNEVKYRPNRNYLVYYPQMSGMSESIQAIVNERLKNIAITEKVSETDELEYSYEGDFSIEFYKKNLLVLKFEGYNYPFGAAHGMPRKDFAHLDLVTGRFYELKDLFENNSNYVEVLSDIVRKQIEKQGPDSFVWIDSYNGIKEDQPFFINEDGLNIYFYPYDIAPYAAGFPTFTILFGEIMDIIDVQGDFWRSFN